MKQIFALVVAFTITTTAFSQAGQKWSTTGNATTSGDFIGTTNNEPLIFKTNDIVRGKFTASGKFQVKNLEGIGFRLLQTDSSGKLSPFPMSNDNEVLYGDGIWRPLPTPPPSTWELNGTSLFYLNGKVGIGTKTPFTNFDVIGDAYISNNLYVGGGIIITEKINANKEVLTAALRADSIVMDSTKAVYGYSVFKDQVRLENKLQVVGNTQIDGNFRVNGDFIFGDNKRIGYLPTSGGSPEVISFGGLPHPPLPNLPCLFPAPNVPIINQFDGMIQAINTSIPSLGGTTNILSMGFDGANGIIDMSGTNNQGGPSLLINYYCGKNVAINTGVNGGNVIMTSAALGNVGIGTNNPTAKLDVVGGVTGSGDFISNGFMQSALGYKFPDGSIQSTAAFSLGSQSSPFQEIYVNNYIKIGTNSLWLNSGTGGNNEIYTTNGALVINPVGVSVGGGPASTGENTCINPTLGNVGIGTSNPQDKFQIGEGFNKINMGFLSGDENSDCITSYLGFNAAKTTAGWVFNSNGTHNGGAVITASNSGQIRFIIKRNPNGAGIGGECVLGTGTSDETLDNNQLFERTKMVIMPNGNVGIGAITPQDKLQVGNNSTKFVVGSAYSQDLNYGTSYIGFNAARDIVSWGTQSDGANNGGSILYSNIFGDVFFATIPTTGATEQVGISDATILNNTRLFIGANGKVGINTRDTKGYQFAVNGNMIAGEIVVKNNANWPDYVFNEEYPLKKLSDLEEFIKTNNHLPDVPTEKEVKENGIKLGDMNAVLLQKIEELTLYIIDLEKRLKKVEVGKE